MQLIETNSEGLKHEFKVTLSAESITAKIDVRLAEISRTLRLPGFRPGKAPMKLVYKRYSLAVRAEVITALVQESATQILKERNLRPALEPQVRILFGEEEGGGDLAFTLTLEVLPELPVIDFTTLHLERLRAEVDDQAVERVLTELTTTQQQGRSVAEDRPAHAGDVVVVDVRATIDGYDVPDIAKTDIVLELGANNFVPGFDEALIGTRVGEKRSFTLIWPRGDQAGKAVALAVEVKALQAAACIDDALTRSRHSIEHPDALRDVVRQKLTQHYTAQSRARLKRVLFDRLAADYTFAVPSGMLDAEFNAIWHHVVGARAKNKLGPDEMAKDEETLKTEYRAVAERRIRLGLLLAEIGHVYNVTLTQTDIAQALTTENGELPPDFKQGILKYYQRMPKLLDVLKVSVFEEKVVDFVLATVPVTDRIVTAEELFSDPTI